jgi:hypothetical protein
MEIQDIRRRRLAEVIDRKTNGNVAAFGRMVKKSSTQLNDMLAGRKSFGEKVARDIENHAKLPPLSLDDEKPANFGEMREPIAPYEGREGYIRLPLLDVAVSAGTGAEVGNEGEVVQYLDVAEWWAQQNLGRDLSRIRVLTARGDSMAPDIHPGDVLFVDVGVQRFEAPGVYVLNWQGRALVKRLVPELRTGRLALHSTNPAYPVEYVDPDEIDELHVSGRLRACWTLRRY